jgi:hypothetical protein
MSELDVNEARMRWEDAVGHSLKVIGETTLASDKALLQLVEALIARVMALEEQMEMLMELHRVKE